MELVSLVGVVLLLVQACLYAALRFRLRYAVIAVDLLPPTVRSVGLGCIGILFANGLYSVIRHNEGLFLACLAFSLALTVLSNESLAREIKQSTSLELNLTYLKKQASQQQEGLKLLMKTQADAALSSELAATQSIVKNLRRRIQELEVENKHLSEDSVALKKAN